MKNVKYLYNKNYKALIIIKETEKDTKWKTSTCSWTEIINIVKMPIRPQVIYSYNAILTKILLACYRKLEKTF